MKSNLLIFLYLTFFSFVFLSSSFTNCRLPTAGLFVFSKLQTSNYERTLFPPPDSRLPTFSYLRRDEFRLISGTGSDIPPDPFFFEITGPNTRLFFYLSSFPNCRLPTAGSFFPSCPELQTPNIPLGYRPPIFCRVLVYFSFPNHEPRYLP